MGYVMFCVGYHYIDDIMGTMGLSSPASPSVTPLFIQAQIKKITLRVTGVCAENSPMTG